VKAASPAGAESMAFAGAVREDESGIAPIGGEWRTNPATGGIVLDGAVLFTAGSATLRNAAADPVLDRLVAELNRPELRDALVRVDGHTDDTPISKSKHRDNWELAGKRALAVLNYLEDHGVAPERLSFAGFGSSRPVATAEGRDARAQNRRVEIVLSRRK
jgi:chemotaxis protein MotB